MELPGKLSRILAASVDAIAQVYTCRNKKGKLHRYMSFQTYDLVNVGCWNWPSRIEFAFYHLYIISRTELQGELGKVKVMQVGLEEIIHLFK